jgi:hypothetical protein
VLGKIDVDEANNATDIEFSADGTTAYVVDLMFDSYHLFSTRKGQAGDVTTVFAPPSAFGPGGADPTAPCVPDALQPVANEVPFRIAPQAQLSVIDGFNPVDTTFTVVSTGVDFDTATFMTSGLSRMRPVPDGIGTAPIGVRLSPDGTAAYVANYLARNVVPVATAAPRDTTGRPVNLRCTANVTQTCSTDTDCPSDQGFCNHPGGPACTSSTDCGADGPCINRSDCVPLILGAPVSSLADPDPVPAAILDGKILFNTAARDASVPNGIGLGAAAPLFNDPSLTARLPASVVSVSRDASYVTCSSCHADFGGQDGRTWDFSQFGASLRNTMDLRGRAAFAPGHCSQDAAVECFFDAACGEGNFCRMREELIPPNVPAEDRTRYFNPMLTAHWNGDRDEVEDFEHTFRQLLGAGDCDGTEDTVEGCPGALVQRSPLTSTDPVDVNDDLGVPNRNLRGRIDPSTIVGIRLTHVADFVYSLTEFVPNPNPITGAAARGRDLFNDPQMRCAQCHDSLGTVGRQLFTDKRPKRAGEDFVATEPAGADRNNPFLRHDVGTANLFDAADPFQVATATGSFQNPRSVPPIPASRGVLDEYLTPVLNDLWNTRPYLHDGSAHFLLDVVRPCDTHLDDCRRAGRGRNLDDRHGATSMLTPQDLNALTGFLRTLTVNTPVGVGERAVNSGTLILRRATLAFPRRGRPAFKASGILRAAPSRVDPAGGVTLSLATPGGEEMMIFSRRLATVRRGRGFMARSDEGGVAVRLRLRQLAGDRIRFTASGAGPGVAVLDTGNRDLAVALEVSGVSFVRNRNLAGRKRVFRIPRRRG